MALAITVGDVEGVTVLWLSGRIVLGEETSALRGMVKDLIDGGKKRLVLNMDNVTFVDSSGLSALVSTYSTARLHGALLRLCHLGSQVVELLQVTCLVTIFEISNTQAEAIRSFPK